MIQIDINGKTHKVNEGMTISQYQEFKLNELKYNKSTVEFMSFMMGCSVDELKDLPVNQVEFVQNYILSNLESDMMKDELQNIFTFNGIVYGLENDWTKLSWGAWVDLEVYSSENIDQNIHMIMAILYRPLLTDKGKGKYTIEPYKSADVMERAELFQGLPIRYWMGAASFFFLTANLFTIRLKSSMELTMKLNKMMEKGWKTLPKWLQKKLPLASILDYPTHLREKTYKN